MNNKKSIGAVVFCGVCALVGLIVAASSMIVRILNPSWLQKLTNGVFSLTIILNLAVVFFGTIGAYLYINNIYEGQEKTQRRIRVIFGIVFLLITFIVLILFVLEKVLL